MDIFSIDKNSQDTWTLLARLTCEYKRDYLSKQ